MSKREKNAKKLERNYKKAAAIVNNGDWSKEAVDRANAACAVYVGYTNWLATNPPTGATHPTEEYL